MTRPRRGIWCLLAFAVGQASQMPGPVCHQLFPTDDA